MLTGKKGVELLLLMRWTKCFFPALSAAAEKDWEELIAQPSNLLHVHLPWLPYCMYFHPWAFPGYKFLRVPGEKLHWLLNPILDICLSRQTFFVWECLQDSKCFSPLPCLLSLAVDARSHWTHWASSFFCHHPPAPAQCRRCPCPLKDVRQGFLLDNQQHGHMNRLYEILSFLRRLTGWL